MHAYGSRRKGGIGRRVCRKGGNDQSTENCESLERL
jgi:hypothetical protein